MIQWNGNTAIINNGFKYMFRGIIRGAGHPVVTYYSDDLFSLIDGLELSEWIFYIRRVG